MKTIRWINDWFRAHPADFIFWCTYVAIVFAIIGSALMHKLIDQGVIQ